MRQLSCILTTFFAFTALSVHGQTDTTNIWSKFSDLDEIIITIDNGTTTYNYKETVLIYWSGSSIKAHCIRRTHSIHDTQIDTIITLTGKQMNVISFFASLFYNNKSKEKILDDKAVNERQFTIEIKNKKDLTAIKTNYSLIDDLLKNK